MSSKPPPLQNVRELRPGQVIDNGLKSGETHRYRVALKAGEYLKLAVLSSGFDFAMVAIDPSGNATALIYYTGHGHVVDGATPFLIIRRVFLPLLWPALVTTGLLAFIASWNEFLFALTFTLSNEQRTVPVAIALISGATKYDLPWGNIMAASVTVTLPLIALVLVFQRKIVAGLTAGAVKG